MTEIPDQCALVRADPHADARAGRASRHIQAGIMAPGLAVANDAQVAAHGGSVLGQQEQDRLIRALESAVEVSRQDQFHAWLRGPFRMLLPHQSVACLELDEDGGAHQVVCLHHDLLHPASIELIGNPEHGLALRLACRYRDERRQSCLVDAGALRAMLPRDSQMCGRGLLHNAAIHRIELLSGATFRVILFNLVEDRGDCFRHLFRLLSAHLTMALARGISPHQRRPAAPLSERELELLRLIGDGKSNHEISALLDISALTLKNHVSILYRKLDVQSRDEAVLRGLA